VPLCEIRVTVSHRSVEGTERKFLNFFTQRHREHRGLENFLDFLKQRHRGHRGLENFLDFLKQRHRGHRGINYEFRKW